MGYVVQVWEQPQGLPWPACIDDALRLLEGLRTWPSAPNPKFSELGERLTDRYPVYTGRGDDDTCAWADGSVLPASEDPVWDIGLAPIDKLDQVQVFLIVQANALGLNVMDAQAGEVHLATGGVVSIGPRGPCVCGLSAYFEDNHAGALTEFRRLAAVGNRFAQRQMGALFLHGEGVRRNTVVACALVCGATGWQPVEGGSAVPPPDASQAEEGLQLRQYVGPAATALADALLPQTHDPAQWLAEIDRFCVQVEVRFREAEAAALRGDHDTALAQLTPLAEQGHEVAQFVLSLMHGEGRGVPKDAQLAAHWTRRAAESGYPKAQHNLGWLHEKGKVLAQDLQQADHWYRRAAAAGERRSMEALKRLATLNPGADAGEELAAALRRAEQGEAQAQYAVGEAHFLGKVSGTADAAEAARWYAMAAKQGHAEARYALACLCKTGDGVKQDDAKAAHWFGLAAEQGVVEAQYRLGVAYRLGEGVVKSNTKACQWFSQAANRLHPDALFNLGVMYDRGQSVARDPIAAKALYLVAHAKGSTQTFDRSFAQGEMAEVSALVRAISDSGRVLDSLAAHRRQADEQGAALAASHSRAQMRATTQHSSTLQWGDDTQTHRLETGLPIGYLALALSMFGLPLGLLLSHANPSVARSLWLVGAALGAYGVVSVGSELGHSPRLRAILLTLAMLPGIGIAVCGHVLMQAWRRR